MLFRHLTLSLLLSTPAIGQTVSIEFVSGSVTVMAGSQSPSAPIGPVGASEVHPSGNCAVAAHAFSGFEGTTATVVASASSQGNCSPFGGNPLLSQCFVSLVVRFKASSPVAGSMVLTGTPNPLWTFVDVGNDGIGETLGQTAPIVLDSTGVEVAMGIKLAATAPFSTLSTAFVDATFQPVTSSILTALTPCGPEVAAWSSTSYGTTRYDFLVHKSAVTAGTFFVFGTAPTAVVLPPTNCTLGTNVVVPVQLNVDPGGNASFNLSLPQTVTPQTVYGQFLQGEVVGGAVEWRTSNRLELRL